MTTAADRAAAERRQRNLADHYNRRQAAARSEQELAGVMWDRARAVVTARAEGPHDPLWRELASMLHTWAQAHEGHVR
ncbi:hypothetical protein [Streptomyces sp. NPDC049879]|uniref:hypothetical protein n=1 Tax=Streptomyces sp. NPDC049879 TaxID=3365598 RepID=UPI0037956072